MPYSQVNQKEVRNMAGDKPEKVSLEVAPIKEQFNKLGEVQRSFTPEQVKFITDTVAPGLTQNEVWLFLLKASLLRLNPLTNEIFAYVSKDKEGRRQLVVIAGRDGKRASAQRSQKVAYLRTEAIYIKKVTDDKAGEINIKVDPWDGTLWGAESTLKRNDVDEPFTVRVPLKEYARGNRVWNEKPETMIKKVAESQVLSMAFPEMGGVYDEAEKWDNAEEGQVLEPKADDAEEATPELLKTIEAMGGETKDIKTKGEARAAIMELKATKKGKK